MLTCAQIFADFLENEGMHFDVRECDDGDVVVRFPYDGKTAHVLFSGDDGEYVAISVIYENVPEEKFMDLVVVCNELNSRYKWVKFYVDEDRDLMLRNDAIVSTENAASETMELMARVLKIGGDIKPIVMKAIYC